MLRARWERKSIGKEVTSCKSLDLILQKYENCQLSCQHTLSIADYRWIAIACAGNSSASRSLSIIPTLVLARQSTQLKAASPTSPRELYDILYLSFHALSGFKLILHSQTGHSSIDDPDSVVVLKALHAQLDDASFDEIRQDIFSVRAPSSGESSFSVAHSCPEDVF